MRTRRLGNDPQLQKVAIRALLLSRGSKGTGVAQVQDLLVSLGFSMPISMSRAGADGIFGAETEGVVKDFQRRQGLSVDGIVGPKTLDRLEDLILAQPGLESPDPARETAASHFDVVAPVNEKRSVYT